MTIQTGTRLGPYEILDLVGAGGMGQVYRAMDTRLHRTVAIKVLPQHVSDNVESKARFEREAQILAGLSHPHICPVFDVGRQDGVDYLVMECLEGPTLAARLEKGALPLYEALKIAVAIIDALDKAHRQGVVHRDLKPGNIILTKSGAKLLDFGLAKLKLGSGVEETLSAMPTNAPLTGQGTIVGTLQYMAPEQLEGKEADTRSDIFAFGAMLYEMITGKKAFEGRSQASLIAAILEHDPAPMSRTQPLLPATLDTIVRFSLAKDPEERWQTARDVGKQLTAVGIDSNGSIPAIASNSGIRLRQRFIWGGLIAVPVLLFAVALGLRTAPGPELAPSVVRFELSPPQNGVFPGGNGVPRFAVSPNGQYVAFTANLGDGNPEQLWIRRLDSIEATLVRGTDSQGGGGEPTQQPFWSPDSRYVGFFGGGKLRSVDIENSVVQIICDLPSNNYGGTWNSEGVILVSTSGTRGVQRVPATGGLPTQVTTLDASRQELAHLWPQFLPDGRHFLFHAQTAQREGWAIYVGSVDSPDRKMLVQSENGAQFAPPNFLLYVRGGALVTQTMDLDTLELKGEPTLVAESVQGNIDNGRPGFSVSETGVLVYNAKSAQQGIGRLFWMDRGGKAGEPLDPAFNGATFRLSPDNKRIVYAAGPIPDLWVYDLERKVKTRLTADPATEQSPGWSPDGSQIVFNSNRDAGRQNLYEKASTGATAEHVLLEADESGQLLSPRDWSMDGRFLIFSKREPVGGDLWALPLFGDRKPFRYLLTNFDERQAALSPDGRWLAYVSNETGTYQVIVQPFPDPSSGKWQISRLGGAYPRWRRDGGELYYLDSSGRIVAVAVSTEGNFEVGPATPLFQSPLAPPSPPGQTGAFPYDVAADGQRFLISAPIATPQSAYLSVTLNWTSALKR